MIATCWWLSWGSLLATIRSGLLFKGAGFGLQSQGWCVWLCKQWTKRRKKRCRWVVPGIIRFVLMLMGTLLNLMGLGGGVITAANPIVQVCCVFLPNQFTTLVSSLTKPSLLKPIWELQLMFSTNLSCSSTPANTNESRYFSPKLLYFSLLFILYAYIHLVFSHWGSALLF